MGVSVPLKLKDSAGLQSFDSDDYDFLAYRAGLLLRQSDSSDRAGFTRYNPAYQNTISVGSFTNTEFDSDIGIGGDTALLSTTSTISSIFRNVGTDGVGTLETYDDSNYVNLFYQTDSALDSGSQLQLKAFVDSDWNVLTDEILSRIYKYDYAGSIRLASNVTDFDSANGGWSTILSNVFTDSRTSDSAGNRDSDDVVYNLFQKIDMTGIGVPSDSSRPFTFKRRIDSAEINIAGRFDRIGEDSDKLTSVYYPTTSGIIGNATRNRTAIGLSTDNNGDISNLRLALNQEWFDKIVGVHPLVPSTVDAPTLKRGTNGQRTEFSSPVTGGDTLSNGPFTVDRDSGNQTWFGIKATVDLVDSARFGDLSATFASTDTVMQQYANSDGTFSFQFDFPANTRFALNKIKDDGSVLDSSADRFFYQRAEGASSPDDATANKLVATARAGRNWLVFSGANGTVFTDSDHQLVPDSDTKVLLGRMKFNSRFANLTNSLDLTLDSDTDIIGGDSADNISLILKNDFQGLQLADSDNLDETLGTRIRNRLISIDVVGAAKIFSAAQGNPLQNGLTGTWISKGTATDTRKALVDTNYTRTRVSTYARLRTSSYTTEFSDTYQIIRTSQYSDGYIGNYSRDFTRGRTSNFTRNSTRTSTYAAFTGNFAGNFTGNYIAASYSRISTVNLGSAYGTNPLGPPGEYYWQIVSFPNTDIQIVWDGAYYSGSFSNAANITTLYGSGGSLYTSPVYGTYQTFQRGAQRASNLSGAYYSVTRVNNFTGNYIVSYSRTSTRTSTRASTRNSLLSFTGDYTRDFTGNYTGEFTRTRPAFFSRNFEGNYTGNYSRNFEGNYTGNYVGTVTAAAKTTTGTGTKTQTGTDGTTARTVTVGSDTTNIAAQTAASASSPSSGTPSSATVTFQGHVLTCEVVYRSGTGPQAGTPFQSGRNNYSCELWYPNESSGTRLTGAYIWNSGSGTSFNTSQFYPLVYELSRAQILGNSSYTYTDPQRGTTNTVTIEGQNRGARFAFSFIDYFIIGQSAGSGWSNNAANINTETGVVSFPSQNKNVSYTRTSLRSRASTYSADYARTRTSTYQAGQNFSRDFQGEYLGNYIGNFTREFIGNYSRNFIGDFTGDAISSSSETIETYTLYVKVG